MPREIVLERLDRIGAAPGQIEPNRVDIGIAGAVRLELGGAGKLGDRLALALPPHEREAERMMEPCVPRRGFEPLAQHALRVRVASELAVEVGEIGRRRSIGWAQTKRRLKLGFSLCRLATPCMQIAERRPRLGPVRVQFLRGDELLRRAVELVAVGSRQSIIWDARKQRYRTQAHAADRIGKSAGETNGQS